MYTIKLWGKESIEEKEGGSSSRSSLSPWVLVLSLTCVADVQGAALGSQHAAVQGEFIILMRTLSPVSGHFCPNTLPSEDHRSGLPDELSTSFLKVPSMPKYRVLKLICFVCWTILTCPYSFPSAHTGLSSWNALLWFLHRHKTTSAQWCSKAFLYDKNSRAMAMYQMRVGRELMRNRLLCFGLQMYVSCMP